MRRRRDDRLPPPSSPFAPLAYLTVVLSFGFRLWVALLGRKRATKFLIGGAVVSTIAVVILELRGV